MLAKATTVEEILRIQNEIFNQQNQIDSITGQLNYYDGASKTTLISVYLSTDELGLPYTPVQSWRPAVVFKQAYRSLLMNLSQVGTAAIWFIVYMPVIVVALILFLATKKYLNSRKANK